MSAKYVVSTNAPAQPLTSDKSTLIRIHKGQHLRVQDQPDGSGRDADNVVATRQGQNLSLRYADGSVVVVQDFFVECVDGACTVTLPGIGEGHALDAGAAVDNSAGPEGALVYVHGDQAALMTLAAGDPELAGILRHQDDSDGLVSWWPDSETTAFSGASWISAGGILALGALGAASLSDGRDHTVTPEPPAPTATVITGTIVAGPASPDNDMLVQVFAADGITLLGESRVDASGQYRIDIGSYTGVVIARLISTGDNGDYVDEATGETRNLEAALLAVAQASGDSSTITLNINPLTTLAARHAGVSETGSLPAGVALAADTVAASNNSVASAFGLTNLLDENIITTVIDADNDGVADANPAFRSEDGLTNAERYGAILASLSGMDRNNRSEEGTGLPDTLETLLNGLATAGDAGTLSSEVLNRLLDGARTADPDNTTGLVDATSDATTPPVSTITISDIANDNIILANEANAVISGTASDGATVTLDIGGNIRTATVNGTRWQYTLVPDDIAVLQQGSDTIIATATLAGGNTATTNRGIFVDTELPAITIMEVAGDNIVNDGEKLAGITIRGTTDAENGQTVTVVWGNSTKMAVVTDGEWSVLYSAGEIPADSTNLVTATVADKSGNAATTTREVTLLTSPLTYSIIISDDALISGETAIVTVNFNRAPTDFDINDLTVENGTLSNGSFDASGTVFTATFTPDADIEDTSNSITVSTQWQDQAGNIPSAPATPAAYVIDTLRPGIDITSDKTLLLANQTAILTFTLSEASDDFSLADIVASGGTLTNFSGDGTVFTATFTPDTETVEATISVSDNVFHDLAGNSNTSSSAVALEVDAVRPTATIALSRSSMKIGETAGVTVTFSEVPQDFSIADLTAANGSLSGGSFDATGKIFTATFTPNNSVQDNSNTISLNTNWQDAAGNAPAAVTTSANYSIDTQAPTATLTAAEIYPLINMSASDQEGNTNHQMSLLGNGGYVVAWVGEVSDIAYVHVRTFNADGTPASDVIRLEGTLAVSSDCYPQVTATGAEGAFVVTWSGNDDANDSTEDSSVFVQQFAADLSTQGPVMLEHPASDTGHDTAPKVISWGNDGAYAVIWQGLNDDNHTDILVQVFSADGTPLGNTTVLDTDHGNDSGPVAIAASDGFYVAWSGSSNEENIHIQKFGNTGSPEGSAISVDGVNQGEQSLQLAMAGNNVIIAWTGDSDGVHVQQYDGDLQALGDIVRLDQYDNAPVAADESPSIVAVGNEGRYAVTWSDGSSVYVQLMNADGSRATDTPVQLSGLDSLVSVSNLRPVMAALENGEFLVTWTFINAYYQVSVLAQRFDAEGNLLGDTLPLTSGTFEVLPQIIALEDGYALSWMRANTLMSLQEASLVVQRYDTEANNFIVPAQATSSEAGTAWLVHESITVNTLEDITNASSDRVSSVTLTAANTPANIDTSNLVLGNYVLYTADAAGNLSQPSETVIEISIESTNILLEQIDDGNSGFVIGGGELQDMLGWVVSMLGDVNGDGFDDMAVSAPAGYANNNANIDGRGYIIYGGANLDAAIDVTNLAGTGSAIFTDENESGVSQLTAAGDFNGDGYDDILALRPTENNSEQRLDIIFGGSIGSSMNLSQFNVGGVHGFSITGLGTTEILGANASSAGDINQDGLADIIVLANGDNNTRNAYVIFGRTGSGDIDLADIAAGNGGFLVSTGNTSNPGISVAGAGDINGDGYADVIMSVSTGTPASSNAYIVFGKASGTAIDLSDIGTPDAQGFTINISSDSSEMISVDYAGDVNGDGLADVIIGTPNLDNSAGTAIVVFGKQDQNDIDIASLGTNGFHIVSETPQSLAGYSVAAAGDINGDGLGDIILGAPLDNFYSGKSYVIFGKTGTEEVNLGLINSGVGGFAISHGIPAAQISGVSVSGAGDINGDGLDDLIVGSPNFYGQSNAGTAYVIFGSTAGFPFRETRVDQLGDDENNTLAATITGQTLVGGNGDDTLESFGATVMYGGSGDDHFVLDADMITALQNEMGTGGNTDILARIDGGGGIDTLDIGNTTSGATLDLSVITNMTGNNVLGGDRIDSIEIINLGSGTDTTLILEARDVLDMSRINVFEENGQHQLMVVGEATDTIILDESWTVGTSELQGYDIFTHQETGAMLYVVSAVNVTGLTPP